MTATNWLANKGTWYTEENEGCGIIVKKAIFQNTSYIINDSNFKIKWIFDCVSTESKTGNC